MAEAGASVVVNYVAGDDEAHAVADQIAGCGGRAIVCRADVANEYQVAEMVEEACAVFGTLDIVVANAGLQRDAPFEEMTLAQWNTVINVNLTGNFPVHGLPSASSCGAARDRRSPGRSAKSSA